MNKNCPQYNYSFEEQKKRFPYGTDFCKTLEEIQECICEFCKSDRRNRGYCPYEYTESEVYEK